MEKRERKIEVWSNLYYCHRCDTVMNFESEKYQTPEKINDLVESILD